MASLITPVSCKSGVVTMSSFAIFGEEWALDIAIEDEEYKHFEMTTDINGIIWKEDISSFAGGQARIRARWDNAVGARLPVNKGVWLDNVGTAWLGYTSTVGFIIVYRVINIRPAVTLANPGGAMYDFDLRVRECRYSIIGP